MTRVLLCLFLAGSLSLTFASAADKPNADKPNGNRLTYLDEPCNPWYPHRDFPKLTTPMWVGEEGVEAVVILGIDDMRGHEKWEAYLRPILSRLKQIDGRAPVSIFTCSIDPKHPHLQQWLGEGLSFEVHTIDHPCPLLQGGSAPSPLPPGEGGRRPGEGPNSPKTPEDKTNSNADNTKSEPNAATPSPQPSPQGRGGDATANSIGLARAKSTVDRCIDLLNEVPNNKPVCFRTPCCDSLNTLSPRFFTEIFNKTTELRVGSGEGGAKNGGNFLLADSSVMQVFTSDDPALPRELVLEPANDKNVRSDSELGTRNSELPRERFKKYLPTDRFFANSIENYPYPYVIDRLCWEFPCVAPSDWAAQHFHKPDNPKTIEDWKAALDCTVIKQGVFCLVFHPHNWIKPEQVNELIDHAVTKHGKKIKFLNLREAVERLNKNVLGGTSLRRADGGDNGVRLLDADNNGTLDVLIGNPNTSLTRTWDADATRWREFLFPVRALADARFSVFHERGQATVLCPVHEDAVTIASRGVKVSPWKAWRLNPNNKWGSDDRGEQLIKFAVDRPTRLPGGEDIDKNEILGLVDFDHDGVSEVIVRHENMFNGADVFVYRWLNTAQLSTFTGTDNGPINGTPGSAGWYWTGDRFVFPFNRRDLRFFDLDEDGAEDVLVIDRDRQKQNFLLFREWSGSKPRWDGILGETFDSALPLLYRRDGSNNGFWVHARNLIWMNEDTAKSKDLVERRSFEDLLAEGQGLRGKGQDKTQNTKDKTSSPSHLSPQPSANPNGPKSSEASLKMMQVKPGYRVELVAAEPLVREPVAFDWGPDGKLWVAEMADYPLGVGEGEEADGEDASLRSPVAPRQESRRGTDSPSPADSSKKVDGRSADPVAERQGYKLGGGRVRFLEDTDGDGKYDKSTVFLDKLNFPNGVMPWRDGVLVSAAPDVLFARDTNGDGRADEVKVLLTGFGEGNQQHRVNGFSWGLDNMVHCANGDSGGSIKVVATVGWVESSRPTKTDDDKANAGGSRGSTHPTNVGKVIDIRGRDFRWNPDTGELDPTSGQTQFGRNRDDFGNWFGNNNSNPMYHFVLDDYYTRRNPHVAPPDPKKHVSINPGPSPVFPISRTLARFNDFAMANRFTSANSAMVYRDDLLFRSPVAPRQESRGGTDSPSPDDSKKDADGRSAIPVAERQGYLAHVFISEPVHNLVHHEVMTADGVTFTSQRADDEQQSEFLTSRDNWFRPTQIKTGPDGALYIADMYRQVIEHPQYIPPAMQEKLDLRAGHDKGRIYRVIRADVANPNAPRGNENEEPLTWPLTKADDEQLYCALRSPNGTVRDLAHRMIYWRCVDRHKVGIQEAALEETIPIARLHAFSILDGLHGVKWRELSSALQDPYPAMRRRGLQAVENFDGELPPPLVNQLSGMGRDPDPFVRMQFAYTLGHPKFASLGHELGRLLYRERDDKYLVAAAMSSIHAQNVGNVVANYLEASAADADANASRGATSPTLASTLLNLAATLGEDQALLSLIEYVLSGTATAEAQPVMLATVLETLDRRGTSLGQLKGVAPQRIARAEQQLNDRIKAAGDDIAGFNFRSQMSALKSDDSDRVIASLSLMGRRSAYRAVDARGVGGLLIPQVPVPVQSAAIATLSRINDAQSATVLLSGWRTFTPALRTQVLDALLSRAAWTDKLLDAIEAKSIAPSDVDAARRQRLTAHANKDIRARAAKLLEVSANADRQKIVAEFAAKLSDLNIVGDATRGTEIFNKRCATCHKLKEIGTSVGSDLMSLTDKSTAALLTAILDPNKAVEAKFLVYSAVNKQGQLFFGLIAAETGNSITLLAADGKQHTLLRADLEEFVGSAKSFMPEGLEKDLTPGELADVIAFVQSSGPPPKKFAGNQPEAVTADNSGTLRLLATNAEIYGKTLVFEPQFKNLGYWGSVDDRAVWTINVTKPGRHSIRVNYACDNGTAGNEVLFEVAGQSVKAKIVGTGSWENYQTAILGELDLPVGQHRMTIRAAEGLKNHLMDLKELRLVPE